LPFAAFNSIALGKDGHPIVLDFDGGLQGLKAFKCSSPTCALR